MPTQGFYRWHDNHTIVDPDFDDAWRECDLWLHELVSTGVVALHPDGYRNDYDTVQVTVW